MNLKHIIGEVIDLRMTDILEANEEKGFVRTLKYNITTHNSANPIGAIDLRLGHNENTYYGGNMGYTVSEDFRGNGYASMAVRLLLEVAKYHNMEYLIITCDPDNYPSRRTCEKSGLHLKEIVNLPEHNDMYQEGARQKCIYSIQLK